MLLFMSLKVLNKNTPCSYSPKQVNLFVLYRTGDIFVKRFKDTNIIFGRQIRIILTIFLIHYTGNYQLSFSRLA